MIQIDIASNIDGRYRKNVIMASYTTWHIGGPAEIFIEPLTIDELLSAWKFAVGMEMPFTVIGGGSNILVDDAGIPGITVSTRKLFSEVAVDDHSGIVHVDAGYPLSRFAVCMSKKGIAGFHFLAGIPGTIGGGIATNAGIGGPKGPSIRDVLSEIQVFDCQAGEIKTLHAGDLELGYRSSNLRSRNIVVLSASFRIPSYDEPRKLVALLKNTMLERRLKQPAEPYSAGSVFLRPIEDKSAGWYIEQAGLKGYKIGGAYISPKHANWIINDGTASSDDVIKLIEHIKKIVYESFGICLETEVRFLP